MSDPQLLRIVDALKTLDAFVCFRCAAHMASVPPDRALALLTGANPAEFNFANTTCAECGAGGRCVLYTFKA